MMGTVAVKMPRQPHVMGTDIADDRHIIIQDTLQIVYKPQRMNRRAVQLCSLVNACIQLIS